MKSRSYYAKCTVIAKALAHPDRLLMMDELSRKSRCVTDLVKLVGSDQATVSKHLLVLKNAGLVTAEKSGLYVFYRVKPPCVSNFFSCLESAVRQNGGTLK